MTNNQPGSDGREAHVQVLTAEVRTLVVGARQVTMSVYEQLDTVPPGEIEPFGRVSPRRATDRTIWVVGRHATTGALVSSYTLRRPGSLGDNGWFATHDGRMLFRWWRDDISAELQRDQFAEIAAQWAALTLIVLAGLR